MRKLRPSAARTTRLIWTRAMAPAPKTPASTAATGDVSPANPQAVSASIICAGAGASTTTAGLFFASGTLTRRASNCSLTVDPSPLGAIP